MNNRVEFGEAMCLSQLEWSNQLHPYGNASVAEYSPLGMGPDVSFDEYLPFTLGQSTHMFEIPASFVPSFVSPVGSFDSATGCYLPSSDSWLAGNNPNPENSALPQQETNAAKRANSRTERRRAQNRKAQRAFRDRKESAIRRLTEELNALKSINQNLANTHDKNVQEALQLKANLHRRSMSIASSTSPQSPANSSESNRDDYPSGRSPSAQSSCSTLTPPTPTAISLASSTSELVELVTAAIESKNVDVIQWQGRVYVCVSTAETCTNEPGFEVIGTG